MKKRLVHLDVIKLLSILWVFGVHYIAAFAPALFRFWEEFPTSLILNGLSGKLAVAMFAVILGYLAYSKGSKKENLFDLFTKRYISFFVMCAFANIIYAINKNYNFSDLATWKDIIRNSLLMDDQIYPTFWCMQSFFLGSAISYICGHYEISEFPLLIFITLFMLVGETWISICLMGNLLYKALDFSSPKKYQNLLGKNWFKLILFVIVFFAIKRSESELTYFIDGFCCVFVLLIITTTQTIQRVFSIRWIAWLGRYSMGIFLLHSIVYERLGGYLHSHLPGRLFSFFFAFIISVVVTILLSIVLVKLINKCTDLLFQFVFAIKKLFLTACKSF